MNIVTYATPFFLLAIAIELAWGWFRHNNHYRINDSINSLTLGMFSTLSKLVIINIGGYAFAQVENSASLFTFDMQSPLHWLVALLVYDFCYYWFHRISHERQIFWGSHSVHHQSEDYNLSTALRQTSTGGIATWIFFVPCFLLGMPIYVYVTIASAHLVYQFWIHTQFIPKLGPLEWVLITPSNHRVHHGQNAQYIDKNYGGLLIVWDRLFGTFAEEDDNDKVIYGLRTPLQSWNPLWANVQVFSGMLKDALGTKRVGDKIAILWSRTGWRPEDVAAADPYEKTDLDNFQHYAPPLTTPAKAAGLLHYLLMLTYFLWFMVTVEQLSYLAQSLNVLMLVLSGIVIGAVLDGKSYAPYLEGFRLTALGIFIAAATTTATIPQAWVSLGVGYGVLSGAAIAIALMSPYKPINV
jgi:alkylglycerol monooxygenase